jgi:hypothetical protein
MRGWIFSPLFRDFHKILIFEIAFAAFFGEISESVSRCSGSAIGYLLYCARISVGPMLDIVAVIALGWGVWMIFRKSNDDSNLGRWIGGAMVVGVIAVMAIIYNATHEHIHF